MSDFTPDTITIQLTKGYAAVVSAEDADLAALKWQAFEDRHSSHVYAHRTIWRNGRNTTVRLHREILGRMLGRPLLRSELCDHQNRNALDCTRGNLRLATNGQNQANRKRQKNNTSGYKGVTFNKVSGKWRARLRVNGRRISIGEFPTPELAAEARRIAADDKHGAFANDGTT